MPSRKKSKGKARKAAKEAKEAEAEAAKAKEEELMEATNQLQSLTIRDRLQRDQLRRTATQTCQHGIPQLSPDDRKICDEFINEFSNTFLSLTHLKISDALTASHKATEAEKYAEVYASKLETIVSILLSNGTQRILNGDNHRAQLVDAFLANYFENTNWPVILKQAITQETVSNKNWGATGGELLGADDHTLVQYYRKRIPCSCLDEKYKLVKYIPKMGLCFNRTCTSRGVERSKMFSCSRCGRANYCSVECQRADWKAHKEAICDISALANSI